MNKSRPLISVAIPTLNRGEVLLSTIKDIFKQSIQDFEILIVDQSTLLEETYVNSINNYKKNTRFRYFHVSPAGVTMARNFALNTANSDYVVFLDDDVELNRDLLKSYLNTFAKLPSISAIGGRVMQAGFPIEKEILRFDELAISHGVFTSPEEGYTNAFAGGNCAIKVKDALAVGGFDTKYRNNAFREESDMSLKMINAGMKIYYQPKAEILHLAAPRGGNRVSGDIWDHYGTYKNEIYFTLRYVKPKNILKSLRMKYKMYCLQVRHYAAYRRRFLFLIAIPAALCRIIFVRKRVALETT
jgi:GT2 family glycosyltransferase